MTPTPTISVVMPVYNAEPYVAEAVESILTQTFDNFEFIIIDDGSTDRSIHLLRHYATRDSRIRVIGRPNTGIVGALNDGLAVASGEFIARMDADDISLPSRFAIQLDYLKNHPECLAVGCMVLSIDKDGASLDTWNFPLDHEEIDKRQLEGHQEIAHPALMARRTAVLAVQGYRLESETCEDLDLFLRLAERGRLANVPDTLLKMRRHLSSICHTKQELQNRVRESVLLEAWKRRGLTTQTILHQDGPSDFSVSAYYRKWAWAALGGGHVPTARKYAWAALRRAPFSIETWRVLYCSQRGY
ncbi:glycosyltransferase [Singulisphaera sp. Ch08]|uniref:Glycosyltransferase n=1 Tax=Singulisphaera sp. Ch08 TaxID=3120278 RepID=A0AAU7CEW7_9BACT